MPRALRSIATSALMSRLKLCLPVFWVWSAAVRSESRGATRMRSRPVTATGPALANTVALTVNSSVSPVLATVGYQQWHDHATRWSAGAIRAVVIMVGQPLNLVGEFRPWQATGSQAPEMIGTTTQHTGAWNTMAQPELCSPEMVGEAAADRPKRVVEAQRGRQRGHHREVRRKHRRPTDGRDGDL